MSRLVVRVENARIEAPVVTSPSLPRLVHPWAWWAWAVAAATAVSATRSPLLLGLMLVAVTTVVLRRRTDAPWARSIGVYFTLALAIVVIRLFFQITVGGVRTGTVVFTLPEVALPQWAAGIRLGGPVTVDGLLFATYDALRLATMIICIGAANALANPKRALRAVPAALYEVSTAVVIALSVAPQLIESVQRVGRARRLRGGRSKGLAGLTAIVVPVLEDSIERSMELAAGMESRGYGATRARTTLGQAATWSMVGAVLALTFGTFLLLGVPDAILPGLACLLAGAGLAVLAMRLSARRLAVTRYRPDHWGRPETLLCACGVAAAVVSFWAAGVAPTAMNPPATPADWPALHPAMLVIAALLAGPAVLTPAPPKGES